MLDIGFIRIRKDMRIYIYGSMRLYLHTQLYIFLLTLKGLSSFLLYIADFPCRFSKCVRIVRTNCAKWHQNNRGSSKNALHANIFVVGRKETQNLSYLENKSTNLVSFGQFTVIYDRFEIWKMICLWFLNDPLMFENPQGYGQVKGIYQNAKYALSNNCHPQEYAA